MHGHFTPKAHKALQFAKFEAYLFGSKTVTVEHLLLGLIRSTPSLLNQHLPSHDLEKLRQQVGAGAKVMLQPVSDERPFSSGFERALTHAVNEAQGKPIAPEHLLYGIVAENSCDAAQILKSRGVDSGILHKQIESDGKQEKAVDDLGFGDST